MEGSIDEYNIRRQLLSRAWRPRTLSVPVGKRLVVIMAHPDDESIGAGGLLWAHRDFAEIHFITICNGDNGGALAYPVRDSETAKRMMADTRKTELSKTATILNARSCHFLDYSDGSIEYTLEAAEALRVLLGRIAPDVVLLPWFLDNHADHRGTNVLYAWGCADLQHVVLGYEIWSMLEPNALFDISHCLEDKLSLVRNYESQLRTVDYLNYVSGLAKVRAYLYPLNPNRTGAVEGYLALPNPEYCALVCEMYGTASSIKDSAYSLLGITHRS